jgi:hypothetical protein
MGRGTGQFDFDPDPDFDPDKKPYAIALIGVATEVKAKEMVALIMPGHILGRKRIKSWMSLFTLSFLPVVMQVKI